MKKIPLTQGKYAIVDDEDYEWLSQHKWHATPCPGNPSHPGEWWYAQRATPNGVVRMHVEIAKRHGLIVSGRAVCHRKAGLDNRKANLFSGGSGASVTKVKGEMCKPKAFPVGASGYRGVSLHKTSGLWRAYTWTKGKDKPKQAYIGYFNSPLEAHVARERVLAASKVA